MAEVPKKPASPATLELKSGWDDMLDDRSSRWTFSSRKSLPLLSPPPSVCTSPTPSGEASPTEEDKAFMTSTLSYLGSPTAKTLGISSPPQFQAAVNSPPRTLEIPPKPLSPPPPVPVQRSTSTRSNRSPRIDAPPENISSVLGIPWPAPPMSPSHSIPPTPVKTRARSASRSCSPATPTDGQLTGYPLHPTVTPPHLHKRPFENSSISSLSDMSHTISPTAQKPLKSALKRPSIKNMRRSWSKERLGSGYATPEVIHMTVVQETV